MGGGRIADHAIGKRLHQHAYAGQGGAQIVTRPGHQVAAQDFEGLLVCIRFLEFGGHLVEGARQTGHLVIASDRDAHGQVAGLDLFGSLVETADALGNGAGEEISQYHGDAACEQEQDGRQQQIVLAGEHQAGGDPDIEKSQQAGQRIATQQAPAQGRGCVPASGSDRRRIRPDLRPAR